ncbi:MAG: alpha/beta hydrolase [Caulobacter sp.]|nr:alpha/beta hydrolase [Caulobacter sp.]
MTVHPEIAAILARRASLGLAPYSAGTPIQAREAFAASQAALPKDRGAPMHETVDQALAVRDGSITLRRHRPTPATPPARIVYFHGGGWVFGTLAAFDPVCRDLAMATGVEVVSVDYRMAPEHPFPGPVEDAYAALKAVAAEDPNMPIAIMGDSAGGNLAAAVALKAKQDGGPRIDLQVLVYPITDADFERGSYTDFGDGRFLLSRADMEWYWGHYAPDPKTRADPLASPLHAPDLSGLPAAIVIVAGCDPLRDEGLAYADALKAAGVSVDLELHPDMTHGFFTMVGMLGPADVTVRAVGAKIRAALT